MKKIFSIFLSGFIPIVSLLLCVSCHAQQQREDWMNKSSIVFKGEIVLLNTSTINWKDPSDLGVVRVQEIFLGEEEIGNFLNDLVTVKFLSIDKIKKGQEIIVYGNTWIVNEGYAVAETGHEVVGENNLTKDNYKKEIDASMQQAEGQKIRMKAYESEHDPQWMLAEVMIDESLKGNSAKGQKMTIAFPSSQDVMWYKSPRFKEGDKAILFLSRENFGFADVKNFTITTADQVKDVKQMELVRKSVQ
jgi:hypothetical protein